MMAGVYTVKERSVLGNVRVIFYEVTNYTNSETLTVDGIREILHVSPGVNAADKAIAISTSGNVITFTTGADTYDGTMLVYGR